MMVAYGTPSYPVEPMVTVSALAGFTGGPFTQPVVDSAGDSIRDECGWHIAPEVTAVMKFRGEGSVILLPTLKLVTVISVTDREGNAVSDVDWFENGVLERPGGFPRYVEVTFVHGYRVCPRSLLGIVAERAAARSAGRIKSEALAGRSVSLEGGYDPVSSRTLNAYRLQGGA
ncbi:head-tail adaptor [Arthrobacter phage Shoya]|uniref:Head-to-tail adaptor n=1 Tax=Arthrobacter phage Shoya TaxID=2704035 RepID=A0A6G6XHV7_9CAUD|nr:head-tail adaptor [Arthrobacter phage Shoya]QIG57678.1 head-to-tail adaptor [Arthrobacter phage Shoya]